MHAGEFGRGEMWTCWLENYWHSLIGWFKFCRRDFSQKRTQAATMLLELILLLWYVAKFQTSLNSFGRWQRQWFCHTRQVVALQLHVAERVAAICRIVCLGLQPYVAAYGRWPLIRAWTILGDNFALLVFGNCRDLQGVLSVLFMWKVNFERQNTVVKILLTFSILIYYSGNIP